MRAFLSGWLGLTLAATGSLAAATAPEAASAMAPYAMWVGRLPANEDATWAERRALAYRRGRLGLWLEAEYQARAVRATPTRHAELCVQLTRAARSTEDWTRARKWLATARDVLERVPAGERSFDLVAGYHEEAIALREVTDVRVAVTALAPFLRDEDNDRAATFRVYEKLANFAILTGDQENYTKAATALLTTARAWHRESPGPEGTASEADRAVATVVESLLRRGFVGTVRSLIENGIADPALRSSLLASAEAATIAKQDDVAVEAWFTQTSASAGKDRIVWGGETVPGDGLIVWLARHGRIDSVLRLLATTRDHVFAAESGEERSRHQQMWPMAVQHIAAELWRGDNPAVVARLGGLYTSNREANDSGMINLREGLITFATWLAEHQQVEEAQRLLASLPREYPQREVPSGDVPEQYRAMQEEAAEAVLLQRRAALALGWASTGERDRAGEIMRMLPPAADVGGGHWALVRQRILATAALGAAVHGDMYGASELLDRARLIIVPPALQSPDHVAAVVEATITVGNHADAWPLIMDHPRVLPEVLIDLVIVRLVARGQGNRVLEWISQAPNAHRRAAWGSFFAVALPEPTVWPMAPLSR